LKKREHGFVLRKTFDDLQYETNSKTPCSEIKNNVEFEDSRIVVLDP
jgi:hypothetical protein